MFHLSYASLISSNIHSALRLLKCLQRIDHLTGIHNHQLLTDHSTTLCLYPKSLSYWFLSSVLLDFASSLLCFSCHAVISPPIYSLSWEILCYFLSLYFFPPKCLNTCFHSNRNWSKTYICPAVASIVVLPYFALVALCSTCNSISDICQLFLPLLPSRLLRFNWLPRSGLLSDLQQAGRRKGEKGRRGRWKEEGLSKNWSVWRLKYMKE